MAIVWLFTAPIHQAWVYSGRPVGWLDFVAVVVFVVLLVFESIADCADVAISAEQETSGE